MIISKQSVPHPMMTTNITIPSTHFLISIRSTLLTVLKT